MRKIEIKNVKHFSAMSFETDCFTCTIWVDGKRFATAENSGNGGETWINPIKPYNYDDVANLNEEIISLYKGNRIASNCEMNLELLIADLLYDHLTLKDFKKILKKIAFIKTGTKEIYTLNLKPTIENIRKFKITPRFKSCILLNEMSFQEAYNAYRINS